MPAKDQCFVRFFSPGTFVSEESERPIAKLADGLENVACAECGKRIKWLSPLQDRRCQGCKTALGAISTRARAGG